MPSTSVGVDADQVGDVGHRLRGEPAVLLLGQVAERDERRAGLGVEGDDLSGALDGRSRQVRSAAAAAAGGGGVPPAGGPVAHRSTSPITGSMVEHTATASASRPPRIISGRPCRLTKLGPRMCIRYGLGRAVRHQVAAELAPRGLDGHVDLALGDLEPLGEHLEVVDERLHRLVDPARGRRRHLLVLHPVVAGRHLLDDLADDPDRLADLVEPDRVPVEVVAEGADDHVELDLVVAEIGHGPAQVPGHSGRAQHRTGEAEGQGLLGRQGADSLGALAEDRLAGEQLVVLVGAGPAPCRR